MFTVAVAQRVLPPRSFPQYRKRACLRDAGHCRDVRGDGIPGFAASAGSRNTFFRSLCRRNLIDRFCNLPALPHSFKETRSPPFTTTGGVQKNAVPPPADSKGVPLKSRSAAFILSPFRASRRTGPFPHPKPFRRPLRTAWERSDGSGEGNPFSRKGSLPRSFYPSINPALTNSTNRRLGVMGMALTATPVASRTALRSAGAGLMIGGSPSDLLP